MELSIHLGIIGPTEIIVGLAIYFIITLLAFYFLLKNEKKGFIFFLDFIYFIFSVFRCSYLLGKAFFK